MKPYIALSAILVAMLLVACSARGEVRVVRQEIAVRLVPPQHLVVGESTLYLAPGAAGEFSLALNGAARLEAVRLDGRDIPFRREGGTLRLNLSAGTGERRVTVAYRCIFNDPAPERPVVTEDPSYGVNAVVAERGTYLGSGAGWYPEPAAPPG
ncbi:MAG TPA: peptidase M1, partial [Geobacter sulfurreducens]|nr:peptidase M1 [Geobacter sulfurreducens]